jgi:HEAT repeat protein
VAAVMAEAKVALPALTKALGAKEAPVREAAAQALALYGADAAPAAEKLRELMVRDPDGAVREAAATALLAVVPSPKPSGK